MPPSADGPATGGNGGGGTGRASGRGSLGRWLAAVLPAAAVLGGLSAVLVRERIVRFRAGGEEQVRAALSAVSSLAFQAGDPALSVSLPRVAYRDVAAAVEGAKAAAVAMVEADGAAAFDGQAPSVSYLGREVISLAPCVGAGWCAEAPMPRLAAVLRALRERQREQARAQPGRRVLAWQIRVEREAAEVGEDHEAAGPGGAPVRGRSRFTLRRSGEAWLEAG